MYGIGACVSVAVGRLHHITYRCVCRRNTFELCMRMLLIVNINPTGTSYTWY